MEDSISGIHIDALPELNRPVLIAGFDGWGNALDVSTAMVEYLTRRFQGRPFASLDPDMFYRYDESRPAIQVRDGVLKRVQWPGGTFYAVRAEAAGGADLVILRADEPTLRWRRFADALLALCRSLGVETLITLGGMYDHVLHTERRISGIASDDGLSRFMAEANITPIYYEGPGAVHALIQAEGTKSGFRCLSLWCHCPFYLENTRHYGLMAALADRLAQFVGFDLDTSDLVNRWSELGDRIQTLIAENPRIEEMIAEMRVTRATEDRDMRRRAARTDKVINLRDFMEP